MKHFLTLSLFLFSTQIFAIQKVICKPTQNPKIEVVVTFYKDINPLTPFIGSYNWGATLNITHPQNNVNYENKTVRISPEVYYSDINLRGDAEDVYLRLYPHFDEDNNFINYTGQLFVNDANYKVYYRFVDHDDLPGLVCK